MGSDVNQDGIEIEIHTAGLRAMRQRAAELRAVACASAGLPPSSCCSTCGVAAASQLRCEQCTGVHHAASSCHCGPNGCSDSACPGRYDAGLSDSEGGID